MLSSKPCLPAPKLSICISTFNRAAFIGATLESIIVQATNDCEIVVLDGASTDDTERVVREYSRHFDRLRYIRQDTNNGLDRDRDRVVELARGEYCWLMSSKDILKPGAVAAALGVLHRNLSLVVVDMEIRNIDLSSALVPRSLDFHADRIYGPGEMDRLLKEALDAVVHISCIIIKREIWLTRERERYYGSLFIHFGVIFQQPLPGETLVIRKPLVCHRFGNQSWLPKTAEMLVKWPSVVESLAISEPTKRLLVSRLSLQSFKSLLYWRAFGLYSWTDYRRVIRPQLSSMQRMLVPTLVALLPGVLLNTLLVFYVSVTSSSNRDVTLQMLRASRFHLRNGWLFKSVGCQLQRCGTAGVGSDSINCSRNLRP